MSVNLLKYCETSVLLLKHSPSKDFASNFINLKSASYHKFHNGLVMSSSHGINYFENVIKYWDNPISYIDGLTQKELDNYFKQKNKDDYEKNFILLLLQNK